MKIKEIKKILVSSQQNYDLFDDDDKLNQSKDWLKKINHISDEEDLPIAYNVTDDIIDVLNINILCFRPFLVNTDIIESSGVDVHELEDEGYQIIDKHDFEPENYAASKFEDEKNVLANSEDLSAAEEHIRQLNDQISILNSSLLDAEEENKNLSDMLINAEAEISQLKNKIENLVIVPVGPVESLSSEKSTSGVNDSMPPKQLFCDSPVVDPAPKDKSVPDGSDLADAELCEREDDFTHAYQEDELSSDDLRMQDDSKAPRKIDNKKKLKIAGAIILAAIAIAGILIYDMSKKTQFPAPSIQSQKEPFAAPPIQQQLSSAKPQSQIQPSPIVLQPVQTQPDKPIQALAPQQKKNEQIDKVVEVKNTDKASIILRFNKAGMMLDASPDKFTKIQLQPNEVLREILGEDTENWIVNYNRKTNIVMLKPKTTATKTSILLDTNVRAYTFNMSIKKNISDKTIKIQ